MRQAKKPTAGRNSEIPKQERKRKLSEIEKEAAAFFARHGADSVREKSAYREASKHALSRS